MKKLILILLFPIISGLFTIKAQIYSFEDGLVPTNWTASLSKLQSSTSKYKLGTTSLKWEWKANDVFSALNPTGLSTASTAGGGGILLWIYNTTASTQTLIFTFYNSSGVQKCTKNFNLNFQGWRCFTSTFASDMGHDRSKLSTMSVAAPSTGSGTIYFDYLEFQSSVDWSRISDTQYTVSQSSLMCNFLLAYNTNITPVVSPSIAQLAGADSVTTRLENWEMGKGTYKNSSVYNSRKNSVTKWISDSQKNFTNLNLTSQTDGTMLGSGLFSSQSPSIIDGKPISDFEGVNSNLPIPLALDYRMNGTAASKNALINVYDYLYDQGWAGGSGLGSLYFQNIARTCGYLHSIFLMRNALDPVRLQREMNTVKWYSLFGDVLIPIIRGPRAVDDMRSVLIGKFIYALMQTDPQLKVAALSALSSYCNQAFLPTGGYLDCFKPDFTGYAHGGVYMGAYYGDALYEACLSFYLLHDTPYALSDAVYQQLKNSLLTYRTIAANYNVPMSANGRFPLGTDFGKQLVPAFAYLALSQPTPDADLLAAFGAWWQPATNSVLNSYMTRVATDITYKASLGETELCLKAASLAIPAEPSQRKQLYLPFAGLLISRNPVNHVSIKGFSKYIWDYESISPNDNMYGRYLNYGHIEYTSLADGRKNDAATDSSWDWSRIPGTTVEHLDSVDLIYYSSTPSRNFSDSPYLGGIALNDSTSMFSMKLHDNSFDKSFYANKSVFCFGNTLVCLGSDIRNISTANQTETTLFQQLMLSGETMKVNNTACTTSQSGFVNPVINDNIGNCYIVKDGTVDMVKNGNLFTSYINHGKTPTNKTYEYYMMLKPTTAQVTKYSNVTTTPLTIVRKDSVAHIVMQKEQNIIAYSIFNHTLALNDPFIQQVNAPSLVMIKNLAQGAISLKLSEPDMHRQTAAGSDALSNSQKTDTGTVFNYQITIAGLYMPNGLSSGIKLSYGTSNTTISVIVSKGKTYTVNLKPLVSGQPIYVDYQSGNDANDGCSWQTAVKSIAAATALANSLPGYNNIFIKGGSTIAYSTSTLNLSGENYYGGFQGTETSINERPIIDSDGNGIIEPWEFKYPTVISSNFNGNALSLTSSTLNGFTVTHSATNSTNTMTTVNCDPNSVFQNNIVKNCNLNLSTGTSTLGGILFKAQGLIQNCLIENNKVTVNITSTSNKQFSPIMDAISGVRVNGCVFRNNNVVVEATSSTAGLTDYGKGMIMNITGSTNPSSISTISNCLIYNNEATYTGGGGTSTATLTYGCIIGANGFSTSLSSDSIINCTIANNKVTGMPNAGLTVSKIGSLVHTVLNNLFWNNQSAGVVKNLTLSATISSGRIGYNITNAGNTGTYTTAGYTTNNFFDLGNENIGVQNAPGFIRPTGLIGCLNDGSVEKANWKPNSTSYQIAKGVTTTFINDLSGNPFLNPCTVGAYEYISPTGLSPTSQYLSENELNGFIVKPDGILVIIDSKVEIYTVSGLLIKKTISKVGNKINLYPGIYIIKLIGENEQSVHKVTI
jgi:chondroitin-sulfate-ABC endolyase/exolyase